MKVFQFILILFFISASNLLPAQDTLILDKRAELRAISDSLKLITPGIHASNYVFSQSAIPLGKGDFYYQNMHILYSSAYLGITKHFSIGAGIDFLSMLSDGPYWMILPKAGFEVSPSIYVAAGVAFGGAIPLLFESNESVYYMPYAIATLGNYEKNISIGFGFPASFSTGFEQPAFNLNGMFKVGKNTSFVSENYIILSESLYLISYGLRYSKRRTGFKFGFFNNHQLVQNFILPIGIPYIGLIRKLESGF